MAKTRKDKDSTPLKDGGGKRKRKAEVQAHGVEVGSPSNQQKKRKGKTKEATFKGKIEYQFLQGDAFYGRVNINPDKMAELFNWLESESEDEHKGPTGIMLDKVFFWRIIEPESWLESEQMEQVLFFMRENVQEKSDVYKKVVILDIFWANHVSKMWKEQTKGVSSKTEDALLKYCFGSTPELYGKSWEEAEVVYVPFNLKNKHWIALKIELTSWCIYVYDSDVNLYSSSQMEKLLMPITQGLPLILKNFSPLAKLHETRGDQPFSVTRVTGLTSNKRGGDCGVYALKYIELLSDGMTDLSVVEDGYMDEYRSYLALSVWNCKWDSP